MEPKQRFLDVEDWQKNTFERIKNDLISAKNNRFVRYEGIKDNHLVLIYGKSQVGKTTLILSILGLRDECILEVGDVLRGRIPRGNSSTSTAIIYTKSEDDLYRCYLSLSGDKVNNKVERYDKSGLENRLEMIRQKVEKNELGSDCVLTIYIPKKYFQPDSLYNNISIMDMPGVESRNHKENMHVRNLMTRYIPISSVCIIVSRSNEIQHLEDLTLPNRIDWKRMSHRFILVITYAYNDGNIRKFFNIQQSERDRCFYRFVRDIYNKEIREILGKDNQTEIYPIDLGDSLDRLCKNEICNKVDIDEILETKTSILSEIRNSIISHRGERLMNALADLEVVVNKYGDEDLQLIKEETSKLTIEIEHYQTLICNNVKLVDEENEKKSELENEMTSMYEIITKLSKLGKTCISNIGEHAINYIKKYSLYKGDNDKSYLVDKNEDLIGSIKLFSEEKVKTYIENIQNITKKFIWINNLNDESVSVCVACVYKIIEDKHDIIYPPSKGFLNDLFNKEKVYLYIIRRVCYDIEYAVNEHMTEYLDQYLLIVRNKIVDLYSNLKKLEKQIENNIKNKQQIENNIKGCKDKIELLKRKRISILEKRDQDKETLSMYLNYAFEAYCEQRNKIVSMINSKDIKEEKLLLLMSLEMLDRNYKKVTGGIHEKSY